jgi:hypothetical protein
MLTFLVKTMPAQRPSKVQGGTTDKAGLLPASPTVSSSTATEDLRPKYLQNAQSKFEPEPTDEPTPLYTSPAISSSVENCMPESFWDEAYNILRQKDGKLIDAYEKDLLVSQDLHQQGTSIFDWILSG